MSMPYFKSGEVSLYYEVHGQGEPVVLVNGIFMNTKSWYSQTTHLVNSNYLVILHDMRGQWNSDKPADETQYSLEIHVEDLKNLLNHLNVEKVHLVGTSYGGIVAMLFTLRYPEYVNDLTIITSVSEVMPELKVKILRWLEGALTGDARKFVLSWINDVYSDDFIIRSGGEALLNKLVSLYSSGFDFNAAAKLLKTSLSLESRPLTPYLREINVPTLVIAADEDRIMPPKYSRIIAENIRGSSLVIIKESGHAVIIEKPQELNYLLLGFISSNKIRKS